MKLEIFETNDYGLFKRLSGNRDIKCAKKIEESIKKHGYIINPIIVNEKMEIIDGQNRVAALEKLNMPVQYYVVEGATIETARALNLGRTNWKPIDYVQSYAEDGVKAYQLLLKLSIENKWLSLQELWGIAKGIIVVSGWRVAGINDGNFELDEEEYNETQRIIDELSEIEEPMRAIPGAKRTVVTAVAWCMRNEGCDNKRLIKVIQQKYPLLRPVVDAEHLLYDITKIYNDGLKIKSRRINFDVIYRDM